ncbi:MAG: hypothetical protein ABW234_05710, partial [Actinomycetes bacterium]
SGIASASAFVSAIFLAAASPASGVDFADGPPDVERDDDFADSLDLEGLTLEEFLELGFLVAMSRYYGPARFRAMSDVLASRGMNDRKIPRVWDAAYAKTMVRLVREPSIRHCY